MQHPNAESVAGPTVDLRRWLFVPQPRALFFAASTEDQLHPIATERTKRPAAQPVDKQQQHVRTEAARTGKTNFGVLAAGSLGGLRGFATELACLPSLLAYPSRASHVASCAATNATWHFNVFASWAGSKEARLTTSEC